MIKRFSFDKVRRSVQDKNVIVFQGYANEAFTSANKAEVCFTAGGKKYKTEAEVSVRKLSPVFAVVRAGAPLSYMVFVYVKTDNKLGEYLKASGSEAESGLQNGTVSVKISGDDGEETELFRGRASLVKKGLGRILYAIDDIEKNDGKLTVAGWTVDCDEIRIGLYKKNGKGYERIESKVDWDVREDALTFVPECESSRKAGFKVTAETDEKKLKLLIQTRSIKKIITVNAMENSVKSQITGRVAQTWHTVEYNINTIGFAGTMRKIARKVLPGGVLKSIDYNVWRTDRIPDEEKLEYQRQRDKEFAIRPKFSIVVPMYESDERLLTEMIESVKAQTYTNWELCLSDGSADKSRLYDIVKKYSDEDGRIRYIGDTKSDKTLGIAENTNQAMEKASGDYIVFGDHDDLFAPDALYECVYLINEKAEKEGLKEINYIYSDEDKINEEGTKYSDPHFKPDFNIDLLRSVNYISHMSVVSRKLADYVGKLDPEFNGAQDYDYILRCVDTLTEMKRLLNPTVYHIPKVLYHWRTIAASTAANPKSKMYAFEAGKRAIEEHLKRNSLKATVEMGEDLGYYDVHYTVAEEVRKGDADRPLLSIIIPNINIIYFFNIIIDSIDKRSTFRNYEFVVVENNSTEKATFDYYKEIEKRDNVQVVYWKEEFNFSAINNFGAAAAKGDVYLLLNNDTELMNDDAIEDMLGYCMRPEVGAVGARLYYDDDTIQHAGCIIGIGGIAGHCFQRQPELPGTVYFNRSKMTCDYSAVTAACLMIRRDVYEKVEGLDEKFKVAFNDIDFCLKIRAAGYLVVYDAWARFHHYESKSRGYEDTVEKKERFRREITRLHQKWTDILTEGDPYYNPNLTLEKQDFSLRY